MLSGFSRSIKKVNVVAMKEEKLSQLEEMNSQRNHGVLEKTDCLKNIKLLNSNLKNLEKDQNLSLLNKKGDNYRDYQVFEEILLKYDSERKAEKTKLIQQLSKANQLIKKFRGEVKVIKPTPENVEKLRLFMENIESSIYSLKELQRAKTDEFLNEEKLLNKEIDAFDKKFDIWLTQKNDSGGFKSDRAHSVSNLKEFLDNTGTDLLPEVLAFDKFLVQNGGHKGGWDEYDHNIFTKTRFKYKGNAAFLDELNGLIATKTADEIDKHEKWYQEYLKLNDAKKIAIKQWRENKKHSREQAFNIDENQRKLNEEMEKEMQKLTEEQKLIEKQERNKKLNEWRLQREIEKAEEEERKRRQKLKEIELENQKRLKHMEQREEVEQIKQTKAEYLSYIQMQNEIKARAEREYKSKMANMEVENFRRRDFYVLQDKLAKEKEKEQEKLEKQKRIESARLDIQVPSDPTRVYKMTSAWKRRVTTPRSESLSAIPIVRPQHLGVPSWRKGVV